MQVAGHLPLVLPTEALGPAQILGAPQYWLVREGKPPMRAAGTRAHVLLVVRQV